MKRIRVFLIRSAEHALASDSWPRHDTGLSDVGRYQAIDIGKELGKLDIAEIYSSTATRALDTSLPTARRIGKETKSSPSFDAVKLGDYAGQTNYDIRRALGEPYDAIMATPGSDKDYLGTGETLTMVAERSYRELQHVAKSATAGTSLAIFTHDAVIAALLCNMNNIPLDNIWWWGGLEQQPKRYGAITEMAYSSGKWTLLKFACTAHLDQR